jgi:hypothetical protein
VIVPKGAGLNPKAMVRAIENTLNAAAKSAKVDFDVTTRTWTDRPKFVIVKLPYERVVGTDSKIYLYVTRGTKRHKIKAKNARSLTFKVGGFRAKTRPGWIGSNKGAAGKDWRSAREVNHPGSKARDFEKTIGEKWQKELPVLMQKAVDAEFSRASLGGQG